MLDPLLLGLLVCPVTRTPLARPPGLDVLVSTRAGLAYPIRDGVPVLLPEAAVEWPEPSPDPVPGSC